MNIREAKEAIAQKRKENRPWNIAMGVFFGVGAIVIDFYVPSNMRALLQEALWPLCSAGVLLIGFGRVLKRRRLLLPFGLTLLFQIALSLLARPLFPLSNSLFLIFFWLPGIFVLSVIFAALARLIDPHGPRPE